MTHHDTRISAAIFDFDGTLVDTMPLHFEAYRQTFAEIDLLLTPQDFYSSIGGNAGETIPKLLRGRPCPLSIPKVHARKKELVNVLLTQAAIPILETAKLLDAFHGLLPMALASSGSRPGIDIVLKRFDWHRFFGAVITGEDAQNGKPAPDLFLLAARKLGVAPSSCIVFEDTDSGIEAAVAAGMRAFDVRRAAAAPPTEKPPS